MRGIAAPLIKLIVFIVVTVVVTTILGISIANVSTGNTKGYKRPVHRRDAGDGGRRRPHRRGEGRAR